MTVSSILRECLRRARLKAGLSSRSLAEKMGVSHTYVTRAENGERSIKGDFLDQVCNVLGVSPSEFIARPSEAKNDIGLSKIFELIDNCTSVDTFHPLFIPLPLQRPEYIRGIYTDLTSFIRPETFDPTMYVDTKLSMADRMRPKTARLVVYESSLFNMIGSPSVMLDQLRYLKTKLELFRVLPRSTAIGTIENTMIFDKKIALAETFIDTVITEEPHLIQYVIKVFDSIWEVSKDQLAAEYILDGAIEYHEKFAGPGWRVKLAKG